MSHLNSTLCEVKENGENHQSAVTGCIGVVSFAGRLLIAGCSENLTASVPVRIPCLDYRYDECQQLVTLERILQPTVLG